MHSIVWVYLAGLLIAALIVMIALNLFYAGARKSRESFARAAPAVARVLQIGKSTTSRSYRGVIMELRIQIHLPGIEPYDLSTLWAIEAPDVGRVQVGKTFAIKIDPQDHNKIYSGEIWGRSLGIMKEPISKSGE
jgi:hypothetical protein